MSITQRQLNIIANEANQASDGAACGPVGPPGEQTSKELTAEEKPCDCDVCQVYGEGTCSLDDPNFNPQEI